MVRIFFRISTILMHNKLIEEKDDIVAFGFKHLFTNALKIEEPLIKYYGAKLRRIKHTPELNRKTIKIIDINRKLRACLKSQSIEFIDAGKLKLRDGDICKKCGNQDQHLQEKGVDVSLAVDMIAESSPASTMYLVSSDTDLLPAIVQAQKLGSKVVYVGFESNPTIALSKYADRTIILREAEIIESYEKSNPTKLIS